MKPDVPVLSKKNYEVRPAPLKVAQDLVGKFHYSKGGSNTGTYVHGLYSKDNPLECLGVAWWIPPTKSCAINSYPGGDWTKVLSLSRLVVHPDVPQNGASFLMGKSIRLIEQDHRFECLVTYGDTWRNHSGAIYKATNWEYLGLTKPTAVWVDQNDRMVAQKAGPKTRTVQEMKDLGYKFLGRFPKHKYRIILPKIKEKSTCENQNGRVTKETTLMLESSAELASIGFSKPTTGLVPGQDVKQKNASTTKENEMGRPRVYSDEYVSNVVNRYNNGESMDALWKELGHSPNLIAKWIRRLGFEVRSFKDSRKITQERKLLSQDSKQRLCSDCGLYKDIDTEFKSSATGTGGAYSICNNCISENRKILYAENPDPHKERQRRLRKENPEIFRGYDLKKKYKITTEEHEKIFESQGKVCAGCGTSESGDPSGRWHTDHDPSCCPTGDRTCGKCIRGILCRFCNLTLGNAKNDPDRLLGLVRYLTQYKERKLASS